MAEQNYDVLVIGAGPGGYVAAIRAAQLGFKTGCVDKHDKFGGTCLRVGCIPSKALLDASEKFAQARDHYASLGIKLGSVTLDLPTMLARKDKIVEQLTAGITGLLKKNKIDKLVGTARLLGAGKVELTTPAGAQMLSAKHIIIATGSTPVELPTLKFDGQTIINSNHALSLQSVPQRLVVIGAGAIGLEMASVWARLGSEVTVLEMLPTLCGGLADAEAARALEKALTKQGLNFYLEAKFTHTTPAADGVNVHFEWEGKTQSVPANVVLVAVGRKPYSEGLGARELGVQYDPKGRILVDSHFQTTVPGMYAIGDVIPGPMLAHKAEEDGIACVELLAGQAGHVDYAAVPAVVYTAPELAWVGLTQEQCTAAGRNVKIGKFAFRANGRALCMDETDGFVKIIADAQTDRILGGHIIGPHASSLLAEIAAVMAFGGSSEDLARTCHAHPTLPEAVKEAAMAVDGRAIHS
ncbi:MAG: dihydrolipoyl dehydrogenase [Phycisphaerae bacterium]